MEKRISTTRGTHCHGDFCALAPQLVKATQERQRQQEREDEDRRNREAKQAVAEQKKKAEVTQANKVGKGYINFSILAAVAMKEREKDNDSNQEEFKVILKQFLYYSCHKFKVIFLPIQQQNTPMRGRKSSILGESVTFGRTERAAQAKRTAATHDIPCKSVLMARVEEQFTGFNYLDLVHQYTQMGFALEDILSECARMSLTAVADKCRAEAFKSACTQKHTPDFNSLNALEAAHRKLVYSTALSQVHPSKFYQTVPTCETCFQLYSCLDALRETIVFLRADSNTNYTTDPAAHEPLPAGVTESGGSYTKSVLSYGNSSEENEYYKNLQKSLSKYSRNRSDSAYLAEQKRADDKLSEPRRKSEKYVPGSSNTITGASGSLSRAGTLEDNSHPSANRHIVETTTRQRPKTAGVHRAKDQFIEGQISDRRTSKLPYNSKSPQKYMHSSKSDSKYVKSKRDIQSNVERVKAAEDICVDESDGIIHNNSSYFVDEDDGQQPELEKSSSYLILANSVPRLHAQSGPTLGSNPVSFSGFAPPRTTQSKADPDRDVQRRNYDNIKSAQNTRGTSDGRVVVTDQNGTEREYNNAHYVHSIG